MTNAVLLKLESFVALDDDDRALVQRIVETERWVGPSEHLIQEQSRPESIHLITEGFACRYKDLTNGKRQIVAILLPGDFCDLHAFLFDAMDHGIMTLASSRVAEISRSTMDRLLKRPSIAKALLMSALVDIAITREWIANLGARNAEHRLVHFFCELYARMRAVHLVVENEPAKIPMTQTDLSEALGLSLVHTNKVLKRLKDERLLTHKNGVLTILDMQALASLCGFTPNYLHLDNVRHARQDQ